MTKHITLQYSGKLATHMHTIFLSAYLHVDVSGPGHGQVILPYNTARLRDTLVGRTPGNERNLTGSLGTFPFEPGEKDHQVNPDGLDDAPSD